MGHPENTVVARMWFMEGLDKTGKTTLRRSCLYSCNHLVPFYDRGPLSRVVYGLHMNEHSLYMEPQRMIETAMISVAIYGIIYLIDTLENLQVKMKEANEEVLSSSVLNEQARLYKACLAVRESMGVPVIRHEVTGKSVEQSTREILKAIHVPFIKFNQGDYHVKSTTH